MRQVGMGDGIEQQLRKNNTNLHQVHLSTGLSYNTLFRYRRGHVRSINIGTLAILCDHFQCEPGDLLSLTTPTKPTKRTARRR